MCINSYLQEIFLTYVPGIVAVDDIDTVGGVAGGVSQVTFTH